MQKRLHWQVFWCFCRRTFEMLWWKCKGEGPKQRWERPLPLMFVDVTLSKRLTTTRGDGGRRVWDENLFAGMRRLLLNTTFCVYNTHIYILVNCALHMYTYVWKVCKWWNWIWLCICADMTRGFSSRSSVLVICHYFVSQSFHIAQRFSKNTSFFICFL